MVEGRQLLEFDGCEAVLLGAPDEFLCLVIRDGLVSHPSPCACGSRGQIWPSFPSGSRQQPTILHGRRRLVRNVRFRADQRLRGVWDRTKLTLLAPPASGWTGRLSWQPSTFRRWPTSCSGRMLGLIGHRAGRAPTPSTLRLGARLR